MATRRSLEVTLRRLALSPGMILEVHHLDTLSGHDAAHRVVDQLLRIRMPFSVPLVLVPHTVRLRRQERSARWFQWRRTASATAARVDVGSRVS